MFDPLCQKAEWPLLLWGDLVCPLLPIPIQPWMWVRITGAPTYYGVPIFGNSFRTDKQWGIYLGTRSVYSAQYGGPLFPYVAGAPARVAPKNDGVICRLNPKPPAV